MVVVGLTVTLPVAPVTVPTLLSIESEVAPLTDQLNVVLVPLVMVGFAAAKLAMVGAATGVEEELFEPPQAEIRINSAVAIRIIATVQWRWHGERRGCEVPIFEFTFMVVISLLSCYGKLSLYRRLKMLCSAIAGMI